MTENTIECVFFQPFWDLSEWNRFFFRQYGSYHYICLEKLFASKHFLLKS